jgi:hypothetical protein
MFPALPAELVELQTAGRSLLILGGGVVAVFALSTLHRNNLAGHVSLPFRLLRRLDLRSLVRALRGNQQVAVATAERN